MKRSKTSVTIGLFGRWAKSAKAANFLDLFSGQGDRIELIPLTLFQTSSYTSLEYPQHIIPQQIFVDDKSPSNKYYINLVIRHIFQKQILGAMHSK